MSNQLKKKTKKKKKKEEPEEELIPEKHNRIGNLNFYSEEISKIIFDKIISLTLTNVLNNTIEKRFGNFCFKETKRMINNIIELTHVNHDNDDFGVDKIEINSCIKYYNTDSNIRRYLIKRHNNALEIRNSKAEKLLTEINNNNNQIENSLNKSAIVYNNKHILQGKTYHYDIDITKSNFWGDIPYPKVSDIDRTSSNYNNYIPQKEEPIKKVEGTEKKTKELDKNKSPTKQKKFSYKNFISKISKKFNMVKEKESKGFNFLDLINQKSRAPQMIDMPSYPIESVETRKELENIEDLRKEASEFIIKREKIIKKKYVLHHEKTREEIEKEKKIKKGKFTYDNEGNLIFINEIKLDKLSKEFCPIMSRQKEIKQGKTLDDYKKEKIQMEANAKKNIQYNEEEKKLSNLLIKSRLTEPLINLNNDSFRNILQEINQDNPNINSMRKFGELSLLSLMKKPKIEPSGSNFQLINPSVGVKIKEKKKEKSGGNNYYKEFHKYSINDFNKTVQDSIEWPKVKLNEKQKDEFISTTVAPVDLPDLKKNNLDKNMEAKENEEDKNIIDSKNVKLDFQKKINSRRNRKKIIENFTSSISNINNINNNKKNIAKSSSEIILENEKVMKLKEVLFHDKANEIINIYDSKNKPEETENIFEYRNKSSIRKRNKKIMEIKKKFNDIDNLNKNLVAGKITHEKIKNPQMVLPVLSLKNNETNFNRTVVHFMRERTKKGLWEKYVKIKKNKKKVKIKKSNSVQNI